MASTKVTVHISSGPAAHPLLTLPLTLELWLLLPLCYVQRFTASQAWTRQGAKRAVSGLGPTALDSTHPTSKHSHEGGHVPPHVNTALCWVHGETRTPLLPMHL